jgi:hypothetical protein
VVSVYVPKGKEAKAFPALMEEMLRALSGSPALRKTHLVVNVSQLSDKLYTDSASAGEGGSQPQRAVRLWQVVMERQGHPPPWRAPRVEDLERGLR